MGTRKEWVKMVQRDTGGQKEMKRDDTIGCKE